MLGGSTHEDNRIAMNTGRWYKTEDEAEGFLLLNEDVETNEKKAKQAEQKIITSSINSNEVKSSFACKTKFCQEYSIDQYGIPQPLKVSDGNTNVGSVRSKTCNNQKYEQLIAALRTDLSKKQIFSGMQSVNTGESPKNTAVYSGSILNDESTIVFSEKSYLEKVINTEEHPENTYKTIGSQSYCFFNVQRGQKTFHHKIETKINEKFQNNPLLLSNLNIDENHKENSSVESYPDESIEEEYALTHGLALSCVNSVLADDEIFSATSKNEELAIFNNTSAIAASENMSSSSAEIKKSFDDNYGSLCGKARKFEVNQEKKLQENNLGLRSQILQNEEYSKNKCFQETKDQNINPKLCSGLSLNFPSLGVNRIKRKIFFKPKIPNILQFKYLLIPRNSEYDIYVRLVYSYVDFNYTYFDLFEFIGLLDGTKQLSFLCNVKCKNTDFTLMALIDDCKIYKCIIYNVVHPNIFYKIERSSMLIQNFLNFYNEIHYDVNRLNQKLVDIYTKKHEEGLSSMLFVIEEFVKCYQSRADCSIYYNKLVDADIFYVYIGEIIDQNTKKNITTENRLIDSKYILLKGVKNFKLLLE